MGKISHLPPRQFAEELRAYLWAQIEPLGADNSGRWLAARTGEARSRDYWRKITSGTQAMTSNDIEVLAALFDQTPYEFIRAVRLWNTPSNLVEGRFPRTNVPASIDDLDRRPPRTTDRDKIAADTLDPRETDQPAPGEAPEDS